MCEISNPGKVFARIGLMTCDEVVSAVRPMLSEQKYNMIKLVKPLQILRGITVTGEEGGNAAFGTPLGPFVPHLRMDS